MMTATIIDGKQVANNIRRKIKEEATHLREQGITPHLTVILVGNDPASASYVRGKEQASREVGISSEIIRLEETITECELLTTIQRLNEDSTVHGILVQLPLPDQVNEQVIIEAIHPEKDVDGFHPLNIGKMILGEDTFIPCTPNGIIAMLREINETIAGKHAVVIGRSNIVGKPMGQLLLNEHATVTYCHSHTNNLKEITQQADILIVAIGRAHIIDASYIKEGAIVIDVGVNRIDGELTGDVKFTDAKRKAKAITPVPGGVGPMTITMLLVNTIKAAKGLNPLGT